MTSSVKSMKTSAAPCPGIRNSIVVYLMSKHSWRVALFFGAAHSSSTWLLHFRHSLWTFCKAVLQTGDAHKSTFHQICIDSRTCRTSILQDAIFHKMNWCKFFFEVILAGPSRHSTFGTLASGTSGSRRISLVLPRRRARRRIRLCRFCTLIHILTETAVVSFRTLPVRFPLPTIS